MLLPPPNTNAFSPIASLLGFIKTSDFADCPALKAYLERMVKIPGGTFEMGSEDYGNEQPVHSVTLSPFWLGQTPVTVAVWREYCTATSTDMPDSPSWGWIDDHPIIRVSWDDIQGFCQWASEVAQVALMLPTEAQWEYSARSGKGGQRFPWGNDFDSTKLWCSTRSYGDAEHTAPVYRKERTYTNLFGVSDMAGNVWEWCNDWYTGRYDSRTKNDPKGPNKGDYRVLRGGSWDYNVADFFRCASRLGFFPDDRGFDLGFRLSSRGLR